MLRMCVRMCVRLRGADDVRVSVRARNERDADRVMPIA
jgi:hypothetical protein